MLSQTFSKWAVVLEYHLNKEFIAQKLCINKAKPKLNCGGKCQMMKKLAEEEKQDPSNTTGNTSRLKLPELVCSNESNSLTIPSQALATSSYNEEPPFFMHEFPAFSIFHPPSLS